MAINVDKLAVEVMRELEIYLANTIDDVDNAVIETADATVEELRETSPKQDGGGDYAKSWAQKRDPRVRGKWRMSRVVYCKGEEYRLTHLLEFGHAKVKGGRVDARPHIRQAEDHAAELLYLKLTAKLRNGG